MVVVGEESGGVGVEGQPCGVGVGEVLVGVGEYWVGKELEGLGGTGWGWSWRSWEVLGWVGVLTIDK